MAILSSELSECVGIDVYEIWPRIDRAIAYLSIDSLGAKEAKLVAI